MRTIVLLGMAAGSLLLAGRASAETPLTDMRATAEYRALVAKNLLLRFYMETTTSEAPVQVSRYEAA